MRKIKLGIVGASLAAGLLMPTAAGAQTLPDYTGAGQPPRESCLGYERGARNSDGGDREHGGMHGEEEQSEFVQLEGVQPYGQWLNLFWKELFC